MAQNLPENEDDFIRMQQEAIRRVREMQERARRTLADAGMPIQPAVPDPFPPGPAPEVPPAAPPESPAPPPRRPEPVPFLPVDPARLLRELPLPLKGDQLLLMGMIYLLYHDGGDIYLILALVFILLV